MSIASEITRLQNAKADIKESIESKGVTVPANETLSNYSNYIDSIQTGGGGSSNIYEVNYDMQSGGKFSGTIPSHLTIDELINSVFKTRYDYINPNTQRTTHITALLRVVKCFSPEGPGENIIILSVHYPNDFEIAEISYIPSTGAISSVN